MNKRTMREYRAWKEIKTRCYNTNREKYARYGGRGITVCDRWRESFDVFYEDMGPCPPGCVIDRKDNDKGYEPGNCRWTTSRVNANNTPRNVKLTLNGRTLTMAQWSRMLGIPIETIFERRSKGWPIEKVLSVENFHRRLITYKGESLSAAEWGKRLGVDRKTITWRIKTWGLDEAMSLTGRQHKSRVKE
jgi:hypothetical protein